MNIRSGLLIISLTLLTVFATTSAFAGVPLVTSYQGRLLDATDHPLTGSYTMAFQIYDAPVGGALLWTEDHAGVQVADGLFTVALGATVPLSAELLASGGGDSMRYLQIQIAGQPPISPRTPLLSASSAVVSSSFYGEATTGSGRAKGIIKVIGNTTGTGTTTPKGFLLLNADIDGDGHPDYVVTDSVATDGARRVIGRDLNGDGMPDLVVAESVSPSGVQHKLMWDSNADGIANSWKDDDCDGISARGVLGGMSGSNTGTIRMMATPDSSASALEQDSNGDGIPENSVTSSSSATMSQHAVNTKGTGVSGRTVRSMTDSTVAASSVEVDLDGDGVPESSVKSISSATMSQHAINTKGTGIAGRAATVSSLTTMDSANTVCSIDLDGDGIPENSVTSSSSATSSQHAIHTKGTGVSGRTVRSTTDSTVAASSVEADLDGDGVPESSIKSSTSGTWSEHAINTKGTGISGRTVRSTTDKTVAASSVEVDLDGDGVPENSVRSTSSATMSQHAINTKGTGTAGRAVSVSSRTTMDSANSVCSMDLDGDGIIDGRVSSTVDSVQAGIAIDESGVHIAAEARKGGDGTTKGSIAIDDAGVHRVLFDSDGNGYVGGNIGVGKNPIEKIDVEGGAYCDGTNWVNASDANLKENFQPVNGSELLDQIERLAINKWNYKGNVDMTHIGPTAQDFQAVFGVGSDGKSISTIDPAGIALAATKELRIELKDKTQQLNELQTKVQQLQALVERLLAEKK